MISVVIPAYNEEKRIRRSLEALSSQTVPRDQYELIVVDGGSHDKTCEIARDYADIVFVQRSERVAGARNDGFLRARSSLVATTDADSIVGPDWVEHAIRSFSDPNVVLSFGPVTPIERNVVNRRYALLFNGLIKFGAHSRLYYYTLGCNTAFRKDALLKAGMYRIMDAGDDLEIAVRMRKMGKVKYSPGMKVGFDFRRYHEFGFWNTLYEWYYIVLQGGISDKYSYTRREYLDDGFNHGK
ncbi:MAG TPA: glycosyltransferase [Methanospirillum sp.]|jgi:cellulose synthase/poly-beta-1,6-N-acetylglucosamine synthase-like glycosyltransferase|uniref:glycosyltransferase n=1 Tax=Methanospirillum sp. TaxID=45200 RepID=UPI0009CD6A0B|nr:glycosyltransferase [Methanospirillum sp.]OQB38691.1 MAG: Glycosyltransferase AglE [Euryarchaeota archaeon ADurb.Bin165]HPY61313.1 glycosyltransferase [Methanospirillum sp.]HQB99819.1 glycosyltransferase [Methanospirillum sp.]